MNSQSQKEEIVLGDDGKALARAPAMTLTAKSASGWKNNNADGSKKCKKKKVSRGDFKQETTCHTMVIESDQAEEEGSAHPIVRPG